MHFGAVFASITNKSEFDLGNSELEALEFEEWKCIEGGADVNDAD